MSRKCLVLIRLIDDFTVSHFAVDSKNDIIYYISNRALWKLCLKDNNTFKIGHLDATAGMIWSDRKSTLYICDNSQHKILQYCENSGEITVLAGSGQKRNQDGYFHAASFCFPFGITLDKEGDLLVTDQHCVRKLSFKHQYVITIAGIQSIFSNPVGIEMDKDGTIYVCDWGNACIRQIKDGIVSTVAGHRSLVRTVDGTPRLACFVGPRGLAIENDGSIIIEDWKSIRRIELTRNYVSTIRSFSQVHAMSSSNRTVFVCADGTLFKLVDPWKVERYLWIGHLKELDKECAFARLPKDIIREICKLLRI